MSVSLSRAFTHPRGQTGRTIVRAAGSSSTGAVRSYRIQPSLGYDRKKRFWKGKEPQWRAKDDANAIIRVGKHDASRVIEFDYKKALNTFNAASVQELQQTLAQLETNDSVQVIILRGKDDELFSIGTDLKYLQEAVNGGNAAAKKEAVEFFRQLFQLNYQLATYTKPVAVCSHGVTLGSGAAMASLSSHPYASPNTRFGFPEIRAGFIPHAGASYVLSRLKNGLGMYLGLTGASISGQEAYWGGLADFYIRPQDIREHFLPMSGQSLSGHHSHIVVESDPKYKKDLTKNAEDVLPLRIGALYDAIGDDAADMEVEEYIKLEIARKLKLQGQYLEALKIANSQEPLSEIFGKDESASERMSMYLPWWQHRTNYGVFDPIEPWELTRDELRRHAATLGHEFSAASGVISDEPPLEVAEKLRLIEQCFAPRSNELFVSSEHTPKKKSKGDFLAMAKTRALPVAWERKLQRTVISLCMDAYVIEVDTPTSQEEVKNLAACVRKAIEIAWPIGELTPSQVNGLLVDHNLESRENIQPIFLSALGIVLSRIHNMPSSVFLKEEEPVDLAYEEQKAEGSDDLLDEHAKLSKKSIAIGFTGERYANNLNESEMDYLMSQEWFEENARARGMEHAYESVMEANRGDVDGLSMDEIIAEGDMDYEPKHYEFDDLPPLESVMPHVSRRHIENVPEFGVNGLMEELLLTMYLEQVNVVKTPEPTSAKGKARHEQKKELLSSLASGQSMAHLVSLAIPEAIPDLMSQGLMADEAADGLNGLPSSFGDALKRIWFMDHFCNMARRMLTEHVLSRDSEHHGLKSPLLEKHVEGASETLKKLRASTNEKEQRELKDELQAHVTGSWNELQRLLAEKSQEVVDRPEWWEETELGQSLKDTGMEDTLLAQMESSDTVPMSADDLKAALTAFTRAGYQGRWKDSSMKAFASGQDEEFMKIRPNLDKAVRAINALDSISRKHRRQALRIVRHATRNVSNKYWDRKLAEELKATGVEFSGDIQPSKELESLVEEKLLKKRIGSTSKGGASRSRTSFVDEMLQRVAQERKVEGDHVWVQVTPDTQLDIKPIERAVDSAKARVNSDRTRKKMRVLASRDESFDPRIILDQMIQKRQRRELVSREEIALANHAGLPLGASINPSSKKFIEDEFAEQLLSISGKLGREIAAVEAALGVPTADRRRRGQSTFEVGLPGTPSEEEDGIASILEVPVVTSWFKHLYKVSPESADAFLDTLQDFGSGSKDPEFSDVTSLPLGSFGGKLESNWKSSLEALEAAEAQRNKDDLESQLKDFDMFSNPGAEGISAGDRARYERDRLEMEVRADVNAEFYSDADDSRLEALDLNMYFPNGASPEELGKRFGVNPELLPEYYAWLERGAPPNWKGFENSNIPVDQDINLSEAEITKLANGIYDDSGAPDAPSDSSESSKFQLTETQGAVDGDGFSNLDDAAQADYMSRMCDAGFAEAALRIPKHYGMDGFASLFASNMRKQRDEVTSSIGPRLSDIKRRLKASDTPFGRETLRQMDSVPEFNQKLVHRLLVEAGLRPSLEECMKLEHRVGFHLMQHQSFQAGASSFPHPAQLPESGNDLKWADLDPYFAKLDPNLELVLTRRRHQLHRQALNQMFARFSEEKWRQYHDAELDSPIGNTFRSMMKWIRDDVTELELMQGYFAAQNIEETRQKLVSRGVKLE